MSSIPTRYVCTGCGFQGPERDDVVHHQIMASERMGGYVHNTYTQKLVKRDHWTKLCKHSKIVHVALGIRPRIIPCSGENGSPESSSLLQQSPGDMSESRHSDDGTQNSAIDCGMEDDMVPNRLPHEGPDQLRPGLAAALHSDISQVLDEMLPAQNTRDPEPYVSLIRAKVFEGRASTVCRFCIVTLATVCVREI